MPFYVKIEGLQETINKLEKADKKVTEGVHEVLKNGSKVIANEAKKDVPVKTGKLKSSIGTDQLGYLTFEINAKEDYAPYVEFGTGGKVKVPAGLELYAIQFKGEGIREVNLPARPYFFKAYFKYRDQIIKDVKAQIKKIEESK
jgi:HK97 gp10 family phage protein